MISKKFSQPQMGVSLLEVLIAMLILAIGALGFAGMQMKALHTSSDANYRARAILLAQDAIERIQTNPTQLAGYQTASNWSSPGSPGNSCIGASTCEPGAILSQDIASLALSASTSLPNGNILATACPFNSMSCIVVSWGEQAIGDCTGAAGIDDTQPQCLVLEFGR